MGGEKRVGPRGEQFLPHEEPPCPIFWFLREDGAEGLEKAAGLHLGAVMAPLLLAVS